MLKISGNHVGAFGTPNEFLQWFLYNFIKEKFSKISKCLRLLFFWMNFSSVRPSGVRRRHQEFFRFILIIDAKRIVKQNACGTLSDRVHSSVSKSFWYLYTRNFMVYLSLRRKCIIFCINPQFCLENKFFFLSYALSAFCLRILFRCCE